MGKSRSKKSRKATNQNRVQDEVVVEADDGNVNHALLIMHDTVNVIEADAKENCNLKRLLNASSAIIVLFGFLYYTISQQFISHEQQSSKISQR